MRSTLMSERGHGAFRRGLVIAALFCAATVLGALPAAATPANFATDFGFESAGLEGLPSFSIDDQDDFMMAGEQGAGNFAVDILGSDDICLFTAANPVCQGDTDGITGAYSVFVTFEVLSVNVPNVVEPFTMFLSGLSDDDYAPGEVTVELNPTVPAGLDVSGITGFNLVPFVHIVDRTFAPGTIYDYIGWTARVGDTISFRYDVSVAPGVRAAPQLTANMVLPSVVPEPGTAVLMGLGLAGLAMRRERGNAILR